MFYYRICKISFESKMFYFRDHPKNQWKDGSRIDRILVVSKLDEIHYLTGFDVNQSESSATIGPVMTQTAGKIVKNFLFDLVWPYMTSEKAQ